MSENGTTETVFGLRRHERIAYWTFREKVDSRRRKVVPEQPKVDDLEPKVAPEGPKVASDRRVGGASAVKLDRQARPCCRGYGYGRNPGQI